MSNHIFCWFNRFKLSLCTTTNFQLYKMMCLFASCTPANSTRTHILHCVRLRMHISLFFFITSHYTIISDRVFFNYRCHFDCRSITLSTCECWTHQTYKLHIEIVEYVRVRLWVLVCVCAYTKTLYSNVYDRAFTVPQKTFIDPLISKHVHWTDSIGDYKRSSKQWQQHKQQQQQKNSYNNSNDSASSRIEKEKKCTHTL